MKVEINTSPQSFNIDFHAGTKLLTKLGWRSIGYVQKGTDAHPNTELVNPDKGERWFTYQLQLGVGEKIYGLGERFGPFVKNGQVSLLKIVQIVVSLQHLLIYVLDC